MICNVCRYKSELVLSEWLKNIDTQRKYNSVIGYHYDVETLNVSGNETILEGATITYYYYAVGSVGEPKVLAEDAVLEAGEYKIYAVVSNMKNYNDFTTNT